MEKRNPCTYRTQSFNEHGNFIDVWTRGYVQDRSVKEQMYLICNGESDSNNIKPIPYVDVKLTKGHWTNKSNKVISKKSFWTRAK